MALANITDVQFDTALTTYNGLTNLPFGALTRSGNVADADPNTHIPVACTSTVAGVTIYLTYEQLQDTQIADDVVLKAHEISGINGKSGYHVNLLLEALTAYYSLEVPATMTPTNAEWLAIARSFATLREISAVPEWRAWTEDRGSDAINTVSVSAVDDDASGAGTTGTITVDLGGQVTWMLVLFVDGTVIDTAVDLTTTPYTFNHDFGGAATYTVRAIAIGPGGIVEDSADVTIAIV